MATATAIEKRPDVYDPIQHYMYEVRKYKLLSKEREQVLAQRVYRYNDKDAIYILVTSNLRLVIKIALKFQRVWKENFLDLIQEGNLGLMRAIQKYDPNRNVKLSYYASFWIKAYILKFIIDNWSLVKIGTTAVQRKLFFSLNREKQKLIDQGFVPQTKLLSEKTGADEKQIDEMNQRLNYGDVSLNAPVKDGSNTSRMEMVRTESASVEDEISEKEKRALVYSKLEVFRKKLDKRERDIFDRRIMAESPVTLRELGKIYDISRERIRQIQKDIVDDMKQYLKSEIHDFGEI